MSYVTILQYIWAAHMVTLKSNLEHLMIHMPSVRMAFVLCVYINARGNLPSLLPYFPECDKIYMGLTWKDTPFQVT